MKIEEIPQETETPVVASKESTSPEVDNSPETIAKERAEQASLPYIWRQTLQDVTITIPLPTGTRARDLAVVIGKKSISAALKKTGSEPYINGDLFNNVQTEESTWSVVDQKELVITLEKINQSEWWPHVVTSAPKIDVRRIEPENSKLSDLDDDTRAMVEKMMVSI